MPCIEFFLLTGSVRSWHMSTTSTDGDYRLIPFGGDSLKPLPFKLGIFFSRQRTYRKVSSLYDRKCKLYPDKRKRLVKKFAEFIRHYKNFSNFVP